MDDTKIPEALKEKPKNIWAHMNWETISKPGAALEVKVLHLTSEQKKALTVPSRFFDRFKKTTMTTVHRREKEKKWYDRETSLERIVQWICGKGSFFYDD